MIRTIAPRCAHRRNPASFRVLLCRSGEGRGCGRHWTVNGVQALVEALAERETHESFCLGPDFAAAARKALHGREPYRGPRSALAEGGVGGGDADEVHAG